MKVTLEDELKSNNPELFKSLQDVKRTLHGHSLKRFQQFEALGMMTHDENSVRATAALRVDLIRRTVGLGIKAEMEDYNANKNEETSLEAQLDAVLKVNGLEELEAIKLKGASESQYEKRKKLQRAMESRTLEIQREAEAVSKALSRALEKYRGAIKAITLQEPKTKRSQSKSLGHSKEDENVYEEVVTYSPDSLTREEKQQRMLHSANDNMDRANTILERLKLYTQTISANDEEETNAESHKQVTSAADTQDSSEDESGKSKEEEALPQQESRPKSEQENKSSEQKKPRPRAQRRSVSVKSNPKADAEYEAELARAKAAAKEAEDEKNYKRALLLDPIDEEDKDPSDVVQERFERIWTILDMPLMERIEMVIKYTSEDGLFRLEGALNQYEICAGGLKLFHYLTSSPYSSTEDIVSYRDLDLQPEYIDRCKDYVEEQAYVLMENFGD